MLESLEALGLDAITETVYRRLLANPNWGVADIADHLHIRESDVRQALDRLADLSLLDWDAATPGHVLVASPDGGLAALLDHFQDDLVKRQRRIAEANAAIASITAMYRDRDRPDGIFELLQTTSSVRTRLAELADRARLERLLLLAGEPMAVAMLESVCSRGAFRHGVATRAVYQAGAQPDPDLMAQAQRLMLEGGQARTAPVVPMTLMVIDREVAFLPHDPHDGGRGLIQVHSTGIAVALVALFDQLWASATCPAEAHPAGLTPVERELLRLLAQGFTDQRAANALALSLRTVRRLMSNLQTQLGARSRFQAGAAAMRRGWV